jgi:hypothetical protein
LPTAARKSTQRFGDLTFGISLVYVSTVTLKNQARENQKTWFGGRGVGEG